MRKGKLRLHLIRAETWEITGELKETRRHAVILRGCMQQKGRLEIKKTLGTIGPDLDSGMGDHTVNQEGLYVNFLLIILKCLLNATCEDC